MRTLLINPPALEPLSLSEIKNFLKIENDDEDAILAQLLRVARESCEQFTGRALITQSWAFYCKAAPAIALPFQPVQDVLQIFHVYEGDSMPLMASDYRLEQGHQAGRIILKRAPAGGELRIEFVAGYGNDWNAVPVSLRQGVLRLLAHMHRFRDDATQAGIPSAICALWRPYRVSRL